MNARSAQALHAEQDTLQTGRLVGVRSAEHRSAEIMGIRGGFLSDIARQGPDGPRRNMTLFGGPFGGLGNAVFLAHHVGFDFVHADGVGFDVFFFVGAFLEPGVDDGQLHGRIGVGQNRDPFVGVHGRAVVQIRADVDLLDTDLGVEEAQTARELAHEAPRRRLGVAAPEEHQVAMFDHVFDDVVGRIHHADNTLAPHMLGAPVEPFPAVRVTHLLGKPAQHLHQTRLMTMGRVDGFAFAVTVALAQHRQGAVGFDDPLEFAGDNVGRFVPGNAHILAFAAILGVALAFGVPIDALQWILDAVGGIGPFFVRERPGRGHPFVVGLQYVAVSLEFPGAECFAIEFPVKMHGADADDLAVFHIHAGWIAATQQTA